MGSCRDTGGSLSRQGPGQQQRCRGGSNPAPGGSRGCHHRRLLLFFFGLFGSGGEKAKPEKTGKGFLRKRKNLPKRENKNKQQKNLPKMGPAPPHAIRGKMWGFWGRSTPENGRFGGFGAQFRLRNGDFGSESWPRRKTEARIWGHGRKTGPERGIWGAKRARPGAFGVNPAPPRRTARAQTGIWGQSRAEIRVKRAPPAQNQLRLGLSGLIPRPPRSLG